MSELRDNIEINWQKTDTGKSRVPSSQNLWLWFYTHGAGKMRDEGFLPYVKR
jgi:hypothetical protein